MKKKRIPFYLGLLILVFSFVFQSYALEIPGYEGGIKNENTYREVVFITGEPILLEGTVDIRISERNNRITERYTYRLENGAKGAKLTRSVTYIKNLEIIEDQVREVVTLDRYSETLDVGGKKYVTDQRNHQWSKSSIYQKKPGVTYFAGNWDGRKIYTINGNEGKVVVETSGSVVGYDQFWGATETQIQRHFIQYETFGEEGMRWQGTAVVEAVHNRTKDYSYEANIPSQISFRGGYLMTEQEENVLKYSYDLPRFNESGELVSQRNVGTGSFSLQTNPINERLIIPAMRDIEGHWAEREILFLASLKAIYPDSTYFGPSLAMNRGDFARAVSVVMGLEEEEETTTRQRSIQLQEKPPLYLDVGEKDPNFKYIETVTKHGIMKGMDPGRFYPNYPVTKAQAVATIIRVIGFENLAPIQQYSTGFRDDGDIPLWAKDAVYVARDLGLVKGTADNYFQPNKPLTKAETAEMLINLIRYLQRDLRYDYREKILNY